MSDKVTCFCNVCGESLHIEKVHPHDCRPERYHAEKEWDGEMPAEGIDVVAVLCS